jgi:HK97 family phage major capsid protein
MPYNSLATRSSGSAGALIPEEVQKEIVQGIEVKSAALQLFTHKTMKRAQQRIPVLSAFPSAYFLTGVDLSARDTGLKQTSTQAWTNVFLNAEEIAVIVPVPKNLIADIDYDFWTEVKPKVTEAFGVALDDAIFFGTNAPATWPASIVSAANAAGNLVVAGTSAVDYLDDVNNGMIAVEADGYDVNGFWARKQVKGKFRGLRDTTKNLIFVPDSGGPQDTINTGSLYGEKIVFSNAGFSSFATGAANYSMIGGDWSQGLIAVREDITMEMFDTGVLQDNAGNIIFNLLQQDMVALRAVARFAFAVPNPINRMQQTAASRYPFFAIQQKVTTGGEG